MTLALEILVLVLLFILIIFFLYLFIILGDLRKSLDLANSILKDLERSLPSAIRDFSESSRKIKEGIEGIEKGVKKVGTLTPILGLLPFKGSFGGGKEKLNRWLLYGVMTWVGGKLMEGIKKLGKKKKKEEVK